MNDNKKRTVKGVYEGLKSLSYETGVDFGVDNYSYEEFYNKYKTRDGLKGLYQSLSSISDESGLDFGIGSEDDWMNSFTFAKPGAKPTQAAGVGLAERAKAAYESGNFPFVPGKPVANANNNKEKVGSYRNEGGNALQRELGKRNEQVFHPAETSKLSDKSNAQSPYTTQVPNTPTYQPSAETEKAIVSERVFKDMLDKAFNAADPSQYSVKNLWNSRDRNQELDIEALAGGAWDAMSDEQRNSIVNNIVENIKRQNPLGPNQRYDETKLRANAEEMAKNYSTYRAANFMSRIQPSVEEASEATKKQGNDLAQRVKAALDKRGMQLDQEAIENPIGDRPRGGGSLISTFNANTVNGRFADTEWKELYAASNALDHANKLFREAETSKRVGHRNFMAKSARGLEKLGDPRLWDMGISRGADADALNTALMKADKGEKLTEAEQMLLDAKSIELAAQMYTESDISGWFKAGEVTAEMLPFMLEMMINPAARMGKTAQSMLTRYAIKRFTKEALKKGGSKVWKGRLMRFGGRALTDVSDAVYMGMTTSSPRVGANAAERMTGDVLTTTDQEGKTHYGGHKKSEETPTTALLKGFSDEVIQNHSEMIGEYFKPMFKVMGKYGSDLAQSGFGRALKLNRVDDLLTNVSTSDWAKMIDDFLEKTKWSGVLEEYAEEVVGGVENAIIVGDQTFDTDPDTGLFNLKNNLETLRSVGVFGGAVAATKTAGYRTPKYRANKEVKLADSMAETKFANGEWQRIRKLINDNMYDESLPEELAKRMQFMSPAQKRAVIDYYSASYKYQGMLRADRKRQGAGFKSQLEQAYDKAYEADPDQINNLSSDADINLTETENRVRQLVDEQTLQMLDSEEYGAEVYNSLSDEAKAAYGKYATAKATMDGIKQRIEDDAEVRATEAREENSLRRFNGEGENKGALRPIKIKVNGEQREVYLTQGELALTEDGKVDPEKTEKLNNVGTLTAYDPESGEAIFLSPADIEEVEEMTTAEQSEQLIEENRKAYIQQRMDAVNGKVMEYDEIPLNDKQTVMVVWTSPEESVVLLPDRNTTTVATEALQAAKDKQRMEEYRQRHGAVNEDLSDEGEVNDNDNLNDNWNETEAAVNEWNEGKPEALSEGMEVRVAMTDENGNEVEKEAEVLSMGSYERRNGQLEFVPDENGKIAEIETADGEIEHVSIDKVRGWKDVAEAPVNSEEVEEGEVVNEGEDVKEEVAEEAEQPNSAIPEENGETAEQSAANEAEENGNAGNNVSAENTEGGMTMPTHKVKKKIDGKMQEVEEENWMATTPDVAYDYLYVQAAKLGLKPETADNMVATNLKKAEKKLKEAEKATGSVISVLQKQKEAQDEVDYWQKVKKIRSRAMLAESAAEDERTKEQRAAEAAKRAAIREQRRNTEMAEAGRTAAEKYDSSERIEGNSVTRTIADKTKIKGHYVLVEADALTPSHDPFNGWKVSNGFPTTEDGASVNDRVYENDKAAQEFTESIAREYDGQAVSEVPVVSSEGIVYDGNGRTMAGQIAARNNTDAVYIESLMENAANFGFTEEQVQSMNHPRVVLQVDEDLPYNATTFARFNKESKKKMDNTNKAVSVAKQMTDAARDAMLEIIDRYGTLDTFFASEKAADDVVNMLVDGGFITRQESPAFKEKNSEGQMVLSADGRNFVTNMMLGTLFDEEAIRKLGDDKALKNSLLRAVPQIAENRRLGDYALTDEINTTIDLLYEARKSGMKFDAFKRQGNLVDGMVEDRYEPMVVLLADEMSSGVDNFRDTLTLYNNSAADEVNGGVSMFEPRTKEDIKKDVVEYYKRQRNGQSEQQQQQQQQPTAAAATEARPESAETEPAVGGTQEGDGAAAEAAGEVAEETKTENADKPLKTLAEVKKFMESIGYNGRLSNTFTDDNGKKFVKYYASGNITPNIYLGETTPFDIWQQFHLYGNIMDVEIPADIKAELDRISDAAKGASDALWAEDREQVKNILTEAGIPFTDVIDSERGSRIVFTDRKNDNGNYLDYMDVADADQARDDIDFIRAKAEKTKSKAEDSDSEYISGFKPSDKVIELRRKADKLLEAYYPLEEERDKLIEQRDENESSIKKLRGKKREEAKSELESINNSIKEIRDKIDKAYDEAVAATDEWKDTLYPELWQYFGTMSIERLNSLAEQLEKKYNSDDLVDNDEYNAIIETLAEKDVNGDNVRSHKTDGEAAKTSRRDKALLNAVLDAVRKAIGKDKVVTKLTEDEKGMIDWANVSSQGTSPVFYSNAERAVEGIKQEKATAEQWLAMIQKAGGLKAGEDKWMGLSDYLNENKGKSLTKQEVLDYIRDNQIRMEEVNYGDALFSPRSKINLESELKKGKEEGWNTIDVLRKWDYEFGDNKTNEWINGEFKIDADGNIHTEDKLARPINETRLDYTTKGLDNKKEIAFVVPNVESWNEGDEVHFGDAGEGRAVMWVRFGETTDADGKKVLVIDEIQSNRHQEGREKGYKHEVPVEGLHVGEYVPVKDEKHKDRIAFADVLEHDDIPIGQIEKIDGKYRPIDSGGQNIGFTDYDNEADAVEAVRKAYATVDGIPDAPFEKNWHEVAMKRMLRFAAENGYDKVAWTKGEQQVERYDLSKQVDEIIYKKNNDGTYTVSAMYEHRGHPLGDAIAEDKLSDIVGKDLAKKIIGGEGNKTMVSVKDPEATSPWTTSKTEEWNSLSGGDLKIGGEGMKGFYDQILPRFMDKYGKKWGVKTTDVELPNVGDNGLTMHSVEVTPEMKQSVMEGQPMFHKVFHGSGADFERFDSSHMGEGEGAQAYGYGHYTTEVEGIGRTYARSRQPFSGGRYKGKLISDIYGKPKNAEEEAALLIFDRMYHQKMTFEEAIEDVKEGTESDLEEFSHNASMARRNRAILKVLPKIKEADFELSDNTPTLYTVEIPDDNGSNYLEWDKKSQIPYKAICEELEKQGWIKDIDAQYFTRYKKENARNETGYDVIVISKEDTGENYYKELTKRLGSDKAASEFLHSIGFTGIKYPAQYRSGGREDNAKNYVIFDDGDLKITDKVKFFKTPQGEVYGFTVGGKIYIDTDIAKADTPIHEYTHLWAQALRQANPKAWERLKETMRQEKELLEYVKGRYPELADNEDALLEEVFAHYSGKRGRERLEADMRAEMAKADDLTLKAKIAAMFHKLRAMLEDFWKMSRGLFAGKVEGIENLKGEDFADMTLADLMGGFDPVRARAEQMDKEYMEAVENGDMEKAQRMVESEARRKGYISGAEYRMSHQAPNREDDVSMVEAKSSGIVPDDYWTTPRHYQYEPYDYESFYIVRAAIEHAERNKAEGKKAVGSITMYRAVPKDVKEDSFRNGDWVTPSLTYAKQQGESIPGGYKIIKQKCKISNLWWDANDINEWGYDNGDNYAYKNTKNNRKLLDAVTYDDNGNVIPLSERFNSENNDIRFQKAGEPQPIGRGAFGDIYDQFKGKAKEAARFLLSKGEGETTGVFNREGIGDVSLVYGSDKEGLRHMIMRHVISQNDFESVDELMDAIDDVITNGAFENYDSNIVFNKDGKRVIVIKNNAGKWVLNAYETTKPKGEKKRSEADATRLYQSIFGTADGNLVPQSLNSAAKVLNNSETGKNNLQNAEGEGEKMREADTEDGATVRYELNPYAPYSTYEESLKAARQAGYTKKQHDQFVYRREKRYADVPKRVKTFAEKLGLGDKIDVITDSSKLKGRFARAKGWYDPKTGRITVVLDKNGSMDDVMKTILHEAVGHHGMRQLFGKEFDTFLDDVYNAATEDIRTEIANLSKKHDWDVRTATEEYMARLAEDMDFERPTVQSWWDKVKDAFYQMLHKLGLKDFDAKNLIEDNDLRYLLWRSYENLREQGKSRSLVDEARDVAMQDKLKVGNYSNENVDLDENGLPKAAEDGIVFRDGEEDNVPRAAARETYERMMNSGANQFTEAMQDSMMGLKKAYEAIIEAEKKAAGQKSKGFKIEDVAGYENAYLAENRMHSMSQAQIGAWQKDYYEPIMKAVHKLIGKRYNAMAYGELTDYMMAKHGLERNVVMAEKEAKAAAAKGANYADELAKNREKDYAGLTALMGTDDVAKAEAEARKMVADYEAQHDTTELWKAVNRATKRSLWTTYMSGQLSEERYKEIRDMYQYYIPLQGFDSKVAEEVYAYMGSDGTMGYGTPIRTAKGRKSKADDPLATISMNGEAAIRKANRNEMKEHFLRFAEAHPSDLVSISDVWLKKNDVTGEWEQTFEAGINEGDSAETVAKKVKDFNDKMEQLAAKDPDHYKKAKDMPNVPFRVLQTQDMNQHQVTVMRNGQPVVMTINGNPRAAQALNGMTNPDVKIEGIIGKAKTVTEAANRWLSSVYTTKNPEFVLSNFLRDAIYSNSMTWVKESPNYALRFHKNFGEMNPAHMGYLFKEWENGKLREKVSNGTSSKTEDLFYDFMMNGGETGWTSLRDIEKHKKKLASDLKKEGNPSKKVWKAFEGALDLMNRSVENCARFAAFVTSRQMGRSLERSIWDAKEVSVNFNKKGSGDKFLTANNQKALGKAGAFIGGGGRALYTFWNAALQGLNNIGRAAKRHPGKFVGTVFATNFMLGALMPILNAVLAGDDDDDKNSYYNLPEYIRRSNLCFRFSKNMPWITIPLPIEFRAIYGLGELTASVLTGQEHYSNDELIKEYISQVSQVLPLDFMEGGGGWHAFIPTAVKPFVEAAENKGWTGLPIYRKTTPWNEKDPQWTKAYPSANKQIVEVTKWLNEKTGGNDVKQGYIDWNPAKIEYILKGTLGGYATMADRLVKTYETARGKRDFEWRNIPMASRVVKEGDERTEARKLTEDYFKLLDEYKDIEHQLKGYEKIANSEREDAIEYAKRIDFLHNSKEFTHYLIMDSYKPLMDAYRKEKKEADEKERKEIAKKENALRREMIDLIHAVDEGKDVDIFEDMEENFKEIHDDAEDKEVRKAASKSRKKVKTMKRESERDEE